MKGFTLIILLMFSSVAHAVNFGAYNQSALGKLDGSLNINGLDQYRGVLQVELITPDDRAIDFELTQLNDDAVRVNISDPQRYSQDTHLAVNVYLGSDHFANFIVVRGDGRALQIDGVKEDDIFASGPKAKNLRRLNLANNQPPELAKHEDEPDTIAKTIPEADADMDFEAIDDEISLDPNTEKLTAALDDDGDKSPILTSLTISTDVVAPESSPYIAAQATSSLPTQTGVNAQTVVAASATTIASAINTLAPLGYTLIRYPGDEEILNTDVSNEFVKSGSLSDIYKLTQGRVACIAINHSRQTVRVIPADKHGEINRDPTATVGELVRSLNARNNFDMVMLPGDKRIHNIATSATVIDNYEDLRDVAIDNNFMILVDKKNRKVRVMGTL